MDIRARHAALSELQQQDDNSKVWQEFFTEDVVRRITGLDPLVGREACRKQVDDFINELLAPQTFDFLGLAFDDDNNVSFVEIDQSFSHKTWGDVAQRLTFVQRWRDGQIFEETIHVMRKTELAGV